MKDSFKSFTCISVFYSSVTGVILKFSVVTSPVRTLADHRNCPMYDTCCKKNSFDKDYLWLGTGSFASDVQACALIHVVHL